VTCLGTGPGDDEVASIIRQIKRRPRADGPLLAAATEADGRILELTQRKA